MTPPILLPRADIDDERWNVLIEKSRQSVVYGYSWYLDIVCDNWKALVWPSAENYQIVMPLPIRRKWRIEVIQQPLFCQYLGLFSVSEISDSEWKLFLEKISTSFRYISSYHFHPDHSGILHLMLPQFPEFQKKENHTYWLSLSDSFSKVQLGFSQDRKVNVKRSEKYNWHVEQSKNIILLIELFQENHALKINGGVSDKAYYILTELTESLIKHKAAELYYAVKDNQIYAGALFVKAAGKVIYLFNAADKTGRQGNARTFLLNYYFKQNTEKPLIFDFESPEITSIASFYSSFGAAKMSYFVIRKNSLPFPFRQIQNWRVKRLLNTIEVPSEDF